MQRGDYSSCLDLLEGQFRGVIPEYKYSLFGSRIWERYLRAIALEKLGRGEEALAWYQGATDGVEFSLPYDAPGHYHRAKIYEDLGQTEQAILHYEKFIKLWKECDPELRTLVEDAQVRLEVLNNQLAGAE